MEPRLAQKVLLSNIRQFCQELLRAGRRQPADSSMVIVALLRCDPRNVPQAAPIDWKS